MKFFIPYYGLDVSVKPLPGEIDLNFQVKTAAGAAYNLKIANPKETRANLEFQHDLIRHLSTSGLGFEVPTIIPALDGNQMTAITLPDGSQRFLRLFSWIEGRCVAEVNPHSPALLERVGEV